MASDDSEQNPYTRPGFVAAAIVVALVVILAAVLGYRAVAEPDDPDPTTAPTSPVPTATAAPTESPSAQGGESVCGLEPVELDGTLTAAPEAEWDIVGRIAAPVSEQHGPGVIEENGFRYCFSQTPTGALLAAANIAVMGADPTLSEEMAEQFVAPGPGREAAVSQAPATGADGQVSTQIAGFRMAAYEGNSALVDVAFRGSNGALISFPLQLVWLDGDWKFKVGDDGQPASPIGQIPDLAGYVLWSGV
ncbi:hypothetical protein ATJ97_0071 [Georgenia soli]|uniref:DUF8175 domain-containing protein n=1 Tax=Georgenia soli TaxID=638953 RepID=A0A2A9F409_9MICO|nr:hypothetical protein [Georgenia soli]PFG45149.1 hypothetical protein ATJ97_0071 [Georgenia soli]